MDHCDITCKTHFWSKATPLPKGRSKPEVLFIVYLGLLWITVNHNVATESCFWRRRLIFPLFFYSVYGYHQLLLTIYFFLVQGRLCLTGFYNFFSPIKSAACWQWAKKRKWWKQLDQVIILCEGCQPTWPLSNYLIWSLYGKNISYSKNKSKGINSTLRSNLTSTEKYEDESSLNHDTFL